MTDRLRIDWTRCDGRGLCMELLPQVLEPDTWGYPKARDGERAPVLPRHERRYAERAVAECPRLALQIVSSD